MKKMSLLQRPKDQILEEETDRPLKMRRVRTLEEAQPPAEDAAVAVAAVNALMNLTTCTALSRKSMRKCATFKTVRRHRILASALSREPLKKIKTASTN